MKITDYPMNCCGMVQAAGINTLGYDLQYQPDGPIMTNTQQWDNVFLSIEDHQRTFGRNCAMIVLSEVQRSAIEQAKKRNWKCVFEFYNPNSHNMNYIFVSTLWEKKDQAEFDKTVAPFRQENNIMYSLNFPEYVFPAHVQRKSALEWHKEKQEEEKRQRRIELGLPVEVATTEASQA